MVHALRRVAGASALAAILAVPATATAQQAAAFSAEVVRETLKQGFEQHRAMDVEFARAIPDTALAWAPTPGVRGFAEQVAHISTGNAFFVAGAVLGEEVPSFGDEEAYLSDKEALVEVVNQAYDYVLASLDEISTEEFVSETELFGSPAPRWKVYFLALAHADWTRGQLVPYFRLHGVDPPDWRLY